MTTLSFCYQIANLRQRLHLLAVTQTFSPVAFILIFLAMITLYFNKGDAGSWLYFQRHRPDDCLDGVVHT